MPLQLVLVFTTMSQATTSSEASEIIPISTKYMYVTALSVPREASIMKDVCTICKAPVGHHCMKCTSTTDECPVVIGACQHAFHQHCFEQWVQTHGTCPLCGESWQQERLIHVN